MALYKLVIGIALGIILGVGGIALAINANHAHQKDRADSCAERVRADVKKNGLDLDGSRKPVC